MVSPFAAAVAAAAATADAIMADDFEFRPQSDNGDVNASPTADAGRAIITILGTYGEPAARAMGGPMSTMGIGVRAEMGAHTSDRPFVSIRLALLPYAPQRGDLVFRLATRKLYRIAEILLDGFGLARLDLNEIPTGA